jgi:hypothetical protein
MVEFLQIAHLVPPGLLRCGGRLMASPFFYCGAISERRITAFIAQFDARKLVVFGDPMIGRDLLQFGPVIGGAQPRLEEC